MVKNNFDAWRRSMMSQRQVAAEMHYHKVSDVNWHQVSHLLRTLCVRFVEGHHKPITLSLSLDMVETLLSFVDEMQFAYIHPRSSSAKFLARNLTPALPLTK